MLTIVQYVNKYSSSFWGNSFVKEMTKLTQRSSSFQSSLSVEAIEETNELKLKKEELNLHMIPLIPAALNGS
jgi:hypothetical protein